MSENEIGIIAFAEQHDANQASALLGPDIGYSVNIIGVATIEKSRLVFNYST